MRAWHNAGNSAKVCVVVEMNQDLVDAELGYKQKDGRAAQTRECTGGREQQKTARSQTRKETGRVKLCGATKCSRD